MTKCRHQDAEPIHLDIQSFRHSGIAIERPKSYPAGMTNSTVAAACGPIPQPELYGTVQSIS